MTATRATFRVLRYSPRVRAHERELLQPIYDPSVDKRTSNGIESHLHRGVEQWLARRAHNPEVGGSNPPPATNVPARTTCRHTTIPRPFWRRSSEAEQGTHKPRVVGSIPTAATTFPPQPDHPALRERVSPSIFSIYPQRRAGGKAFRKHPPQGGAARQRAGCSGMRTRRCRSRS